MARLARVIAEGYPHHITQRGNRRENVFWTETGRRRYLELVLAYGREPVVGSSPLPPW